MATRGLSSVSTNGGQLADKMRSLGDVGFSLAVLGGAFPVEEAEQPRSKHKSTDSQRQVDMEPA